MARITASSDRNGNHHRGSEFLYSAAVACPHGLMIEERGRVVFSNLSYARLYGFSGQDEILGKLVRQLRLSPPPGDRPTNKYETLHFDFRDGDQRRRLHVARDVSERRALEGRLRESEKLEAIGRLVGGVAHDFNNILTAITLYAGLLQEFQLERGGGQVDEILQAAKRGTDLVRQLLTFARQHTGTAHVISLRETVEAMRPVLQPLIGEDIEFNAHFVAGDDYVRADPAQLQQVVLNLVMNARDAMPRGGEVRIRTAHAQIKGRRGPHREIRAGAYVSLCVEDTGCGMKEEVRSRIFEPFFTTKKAGAGTGLGMSMVYGIVHQSGGSVTISSVVGKGTRVTVLLPQVAPERASASAVQSDASTSGSETILLEEDDAAIRASVAELLLDRGYRVLQARDGLHAIEIARAHRPRIDLVLSDIVMPRMSGADAAVKIRRLHPEAKILLISGYPAKAAPKLSALGPVLLKPFSRAMLARKVRETLEQGLPSSGAAARGTS
ncbi:MAG: ATP-binding protein [Terriglobales bacterium]